MFSGTFQNAVFSRLSFGEVRRVGNFYINSLEWKVLAGRQAAAE